MKIYKRKELQEESAIYVLSEIKRELFRIAFETTLWVTFAVWALGLMFSGMLIKIGVIPVAMPDASTALEMCRMIWLYSWIAVFTLSLIRHTNWLRVMRIYRTPAGREVRTLYKQLVRLHSQREQEPVDDLAFSYHTIDPELSHRSEQLIDQLSTKWVIAHQQAGLLEA